MATRPAAFMGLIGSLRHTLIINNGAGLVNFSPHFPHHRFIMACKGVDN